jgi:hypothetical protein
MLPVAKLPLHGRRFGPVRDVRTSYPYAAGSREPAVSSSPPKLPTVQ